MKRFVLIFIFSAALQSFGQTDSLEIISFQDTLVPVEGEISDVFEMAPMEMPEEEMYNEKDYIRYMCFFTGVDFGLLSLQNETYPIKQKQSFSFRLNLVEYKKQLIENRFGVFSGIAMGYQQIGFQDDFKFINSGSETILVPDTIDYLKNQLRSFSVSVPIMFEINSKNTFEKNMHLAFGVQAGYRYANSTYQKHLNGGATIVRKNSEDIYVNRYNLEACIRVGFQNLTFFASRSLTPLFSTNKFQTELYPIVVGLSILPANTKPSNPDDFDF
ncbi:MAG: PorT family protein [Flavobacteriales bacterium]|nr:PorT family protein [Flavobacteriales bacterium]MDP4717242.1 PorT family protein [Flavobacteriales bacterium]MDP4730942.1 PorT family protein [Flavobacteriales bacterium]MDP4818737.1 PorT family protein [Flavobacteriales bacterium]MDP4950650.1 PorT family protein [Flavobacteriales bacterium]